MDIRFASGSSGRLSYGCEYVFSGEDSGDARLILCISERFRVVSVRVREDVQNQIIAELERRAETWMLYSTSPKDLNRRMP